MNALQGVAIALGGVSVASGTWAARFPNEAKRFLRELPRNEKIGRVLAAVDVAWSVYLFGMMNLGGWDRVKPLVYALSPVIYWFIIRYVNQYLGARSLAWLLILAAKPLLNLCFVQDDSWRLVLVVLAYGWVILGICFFSAPHWLRDWIAFWTSDAARWKWGNWAKILMGMGLIFLGIFVY